METIKAKDNLSKGNLPKDNKKSKCHCCENYDKNTGTCKLGKTECNTDFSTCLDYFINESLIMF